MSSHLTRKEMLKLMSAAGLASLVPLHGALFNQQEMLTRPIPSSGEELPVVGLGTWIQFDVGTSPAERDPLRRVLKLMIEKGGKVIDSSPMYGKAEKVIGDLTTEIDREDDFFYATKVWTRGRQAGIDQMNVSMQKMNRNTMDLMQVHNLVDWETHLNTLKEWKAEGKLRYIGVTHYTVASHPRLEEIITTEDIDFVQFGYSIRVRDAEKRLLKAARDNGVAVLINEPYEGGSLFRTIRGKQLPEWASEYDINSWGQFFLKYILSHEAVTCVIPGTSNPEHLADNMAAGYGKLPDASGRKRMVKYIEGI